MSNHFNDLTYLCTNALRLRTRFEGVQKLFDGATCHLGQEIAEAFLLGHPLAPSCPVPLGQERPLSKTVPYETHWSVPLN